MHPPSHDPLDQLVARTLRARRPADGQCPDADVLAAFADAVLPRDERQGVERHVSTCSRCADILAAVMVSEPMADQAPASFWLGWRAWQWAVPAVTATLVAGVWLATGMPGIPRDQPASAPPATATSAAPAAASADTFAHGAPGVPEAAMASRGEAKAELAAPAPRVAGADDDRARSTLSSEVRPFGSAMAKSRGADATAAPAAEKFEQARADAAAPASVVERGRVAESSAAAERRESQELARSAPPAPPVAANAPAPVQPPPAPQAVAPPSAAGAAAAPAGGRLAGRGGGGAAPVMVRSPGGPAAWRAVGASIESSAGGATWTPEHTASEPLTGGAAASATVVWFFSAQGLVVSRTETGWVEHRAPAGSTIVSIQPVTAQQAVVTLADGRVVETRDRGATWRVR